MAVGYSGFYPLKKWIISGILFPFFIYFTFSRGEYSLIDNANLIIHESGHFFFGFMGSFIQAAGGTLMQILFPAFLAFYFLKTGYRTGVQIFILWLGQNLINISVYAADAKIRQLHLLGNGKHDWYYLLSQLNILNHCEIVGYLFYGTGILIMGIALLLPLYLDDI